MTDRAVILHAVETAYEYAWKNIDLSGCFYGTPGLPGPFLDKPLPYYFFLAGFVAQLQCSRILEIGTHFGGSIFSMARGVEYAGRAQSAEIVTVDLRDNNTEAFRTSPLVKRILGDCLDNDIEQTVTLLGSEQESGKLCILRGFLKNEEFGLGRGQALRLQQQIVHVSVTTATSEQSFDVAVDGFNHSHRYLRPAVVQDALEMIQ